MCGQESPAGALFCLNCGTSLASTAYAQTPLQSPGLPGIVCGVCGGENPPGMKFCRSCGSALAVGTPPAYAPTPVYGGMPAPLPPQPASALGTMPTGPSTPVAPGPAMAPAPAPAPASVMAPPPRAEGSTIACPRCGTQTPVGFAYCQQCGLHMQALKADPGPPPRARGPSTPPPISPPLGGRFDPPIDPMAGTLAQGDVKLGGLAPPPSLGRAAPVPIAPVPSA
ncbi:MAG TPA: zinc ribbon domain-containing protein, partial [Kofleriaceae bacterium]|nr:zinc ribbon domain-containing protein [Kofleriaceae bacterium]